MTVGFQPCKGRGEKGGAGRAQAVPSICKIDISEDKAMRPMNVPLGETTRVSPQDPACSRLGVWSRDVLQ